VRTARHWISEKGWAVLVIYVLPFSVLAACVVALPFLGYGLKSTSIWALLFVLVTQAVYVFFSRSKIQAARSVLPVAYISFAVVLLLWGVAGAFYLKQFLRLHEPIPTHPFLMTAPSKVLLGILLIIITALPASRSNGLAKLSGVSMLFGLLASILGGLVWLILSGGDFPPLMRPSEWLVALVVMPGMFLFLAGICGGLKILIHMPHDEEPP